VYDLQTHHVLALYSKVNFKFERNVGKREFEVYQIQYSFTYLKYALQFSTCFKLSYVGECFFAGGELKVETACHTADICDI
jgi:hypothetical protein